MYGSSLCSWLHVTVLVPRILKWLLKFGKFVDLCFIMHVQGARTLCNSGFMNVLCCALTLSLHHYFMVLTHSDSFIFYVFFSRCVSEHSLYICAGHLSHLQMNAVFTDPTVGRSDCFFA
jgi:hypothetical protein